MQIFTNVNSHRSKKDKLYLLENLAKTSKTYPQLRNEIMSGLNKKEKNALCLASIWMDLGSACSTIHLPFTTKITVNKHGKEGEETAPLAGLLLQENNLQDC